VGPGRCRSYWTYTIKGWKKHQGLARADQIFDKISPTSAIRATERQLLLADDSIEPFNDRGLFNTFFDKLRTYRQIKNFAIPTILVKTDKMVDIELALKRLNRLKEKDQNPEDYSRAVILKDRHGSGGDNVFKVNDNFVREIREIMLRHKLTHFVLQPFLKFDRGYCYRDNQTATDIRLIFQYNQLLMCYLRMAKAGDFRCNLHQGGTIVYIGEAEIPKAIRSAAKKIVTKLDQPQALYALDFAVSNHHRVYFIEGNIGPGLNWGLNEKADEMMSKKLIRRIVGEMASRVNRVNLGLRKLASQTVMGKTEQVPVRLMV
jgi:hypothetical protein